MKTTEIMIPTNGSEIVYIAGKVTGLPYLDVRMKFDFRAGELRAMGYEVLNPLELVPPSATWQEAMKICIARLVDADYIDLLPDWGKSPGAILEYRLAKKLGIEVFKS